MPAPDRRGRAGRTRPPQQPASFDPISRPRPADTRRPRQVGLSGPPGRRRRVSDQILAGLALLIVGGLGALGVQSLLAGPAPSATSAPSAAPTDDTAAVPSDAPTDSVAPVAPVSPVLENRLPKTIAGVDLTVQSAVDATNLSNGPNGRALNATMVRLGKQPSDLEIALAFDQSGSLDLTIIGFRADGVASGEIRTAVMDAWLAAGTPGVVTSSVALSGAQATKLSYGDGGADEYVLTIDDSVFVLETSDVTLAQSAASALIAGPAASSAATASPGS